MSLCENQAIGINSVSARRLCTFKIMAWAHTQQCLSKRKDDKRGILRLAELCIAILKRPSPASQNTFASYGCFKNHDQLLLCVCLHGYSVYVRGFMWRSEVHIKCLCPSLFTSFFEARYLIEHGAHRCSYCGCSVSSRETPVSTSTALELQIPRSSSIHGKFFTNEAIFLAQN